MRNIPTSYSQYVHIDLCSDSGCMTVRWIYLWFWRNYLNVSHRKGADISVPVPGPCKHSHTRTLQILSIRKYLDFCYLNQMSHLYTVLCENNQHAGENILEPTNYGRNLRVKNKTWNRCALLGYSFRSLKCGFIWFVCQQVAQQTLPLLNLWPHVLVLNLFSVWYFGDVVRVRKAVWWRSGWGGDESPSVWNKVYLLSGSCSHLFFPPQSIFSSYLRLGGRAMAAGWARQSLKMPWNLSEYEPSLPDETLLKII